MNANEELLKIEKKKIVKRTDKDIEKLVKDLMKKMTTLEKIGQMYESGHAAGEISGPEFDYSKTPDNVRRGIIGSMLGIGNHQVMYELQKIAVEESRLGIPLLNCCDIIHGYRTAFPINLGLSGTFDPELVKEVAEVSAYEASHSACNLTFSPMVDLVRDPRWGRVMESNGEDPYLSSLLSKAYVEGYQGDLGADNIGACVKHYVAYGAGLAGREYNTVDVSERWLQQYYLPPFKAAVDAGVTMVMTAFNVVNDVPCTANKYLLRDVLRKQLGFKGVVISDYTSSWEIYKHKIAASNREVAKKCIEAGLDHEMIATCYVENLEDLVNSKEVDIKLIDEACARVLTLKYKLGLFDDPYKNLYANPEQYFLTERALDVAYRSAVDTPVLLQNNNDLLPLDKKQKVAIIGPYSNSIDLVGAWRAYTNKNDCTTLIDVVKGMGINAESCKACDILSDDKSGFDEAIKLASESDVILLAVGETEYLSGEGSSRAFLTLPGVQQDLLDELQKLNKKIVLLLHTGRPLDLSKIKDQVDSIMLVWFLGTKSSEAIADLVFGNATPSGKLTLSFPITVGQIPVFYNNLNTGRPFIQGDRYKSHFDDIPNEPLYPFGYGLSYGKIELSNLTLDKEVLTDKDFVTVSVDVTNNSKYTNKEVVQLYIEAQSFSVSRPNLELKGFEKVTLAPNETKKVTLKVTKQDLAFYNIDMKYIAEPGKYNIHVGNHCMNLMTKTIEVK